MIVNKSVVGIHIISHEAHGLLAGKIANEIKPEFRPRHWFETLIAICEHDDRQLNFKEKDYLSDMGVPMDFNEERSSVHEVMTRMQRVLKAAGDKSSWVKLLISYHLEFIYAHMKADSKRISRFFTEEEKARGHILEQFKVSDKTGRTYYEVLRFCDRLSLILCKDQAPEAERLLEINTSINGETYFIKKTENGVLTITPWIFSATEFELSVEERILKETKFTSNQHFETVLMGSKPQPKKWLLKKSEG
ncbi:DUF3891 family protein [Subsaximicrobium wynnwilliamsii]|uniref:DUF3891 family protein n=1 Tax=Subsaximicrobium wynnwilliamsii TaxID=291179 RepID=A0A5C6ZLV0_9FLAO|nr:DUF3891 family protein [Subsaximicrobium wynnwilliamsii]TXD84289.1 DUF3891 family protein [Subsaximicrobium wynnwilliamsii]TXD89910.1 DUF3891 family protein [Subsaximicrobium wynnwilliamsii]TXE04001.1 DUF3891 family protein [Subsaximicrobium wynnwilliamsii]